MSMVSYSLEMERPDTQPLARCNGSKYGPIRGRIDVGCAGRLTIIVFVMLNTLMAVARGATDPVMENISSRGSLLAEYDRAAWQATDALRTKHPNEHSFNRYVAKKTRSGWAIGFGQINRDGNKFLVRYEAIQHPGVGYTITEFDPPKEDSGFYLAGAIGIEVALKAFAGDQPSYNVAALPIQSGGIYVYIYPAQSRPDVFPIGGDARFRLSQDGRNLMEVRQLHEGILESRSASDAANSFHTHVLRDQPEDTDVFLVLTRQPRIPEAVVTNKHIYWIRTDGTIQVYPRGAGN